MTSVVSVRVSTVSLQGTGAGSSPSTTLHSIKVQPVPFVAAKRLLMRHHYLHSLPGGTMLSFGVFLGDRLLGVITFGAGPQMTHSLVTGAKRGDCLALTRLWISDELPANSESRTLGVILRSLKRYTHIKFLVPMLIRLTRIQAPYTRLRAGYTQGYRKQRPRMTLETAKQPTPGVLARSMVAIP